MYLALGDAGVEEKMGKECQESITEPSSECEVAQRNCGTHEMNVGGCSGAKDNLAVKIFKTTLSDFKNRIEVLTL